MESSALSGCEVRAVINFLNAEGFTGSEIRCRLNNVCSVCYVISLCHIYKWIEHFNIRQSDTHDEQQTGCLRDLINDETIACVRTLLVEVCRFRISDIHWEMVERYLMQTNCSTTFHILTKKWEMRKMSARWVSRMLTSYRGRIGDADTV